MTIIDKKITRNELILAGENIFFDIIKAVVDVEIKIIAVGGGMHADEEFLLLENGSEQENLWGINIHFKKPRNEWIEFDSLINLRPKLKNMSRGIENEILRNKIKEIVNNLISD